MVGEIRDKETAEIAIKAAQTGHLVLSTLHTNDSISAITRLLDLGMPAFQIASSMTGIMAQRLVRKLCGCRRSLPASPEFRAKLLSLGVLGTPSQEHKASGCAECDMTGYKGRIGIYELLVFDDAIRAAVREGGASDKLRMLATRSGTRLMHEYALDHVRDGLTTVEEVQRVVPLEQAAASSCAACQRELAASFAFCPYCGGRASSPGIAECAEDPLLERVVNS